MTLRELSQLYWISRELDKDYERLHELQDKAYGAGAASLDGMPHGTDAGRKTENYATAIATLQSIIEAKEATMLEERSRMELYIATIDDSLTRQIYALRFINGLSWEQVATTLGGGNTPEGVKKRCYRHIKRHG